MKKLIVGITAPQSVDLINGQLNFFVQKGYDVYLLAPDTEQVVDFCKKENAKHIPVKIERNIHLFYDFISLIQIILIFLKYRPDIVNLGTPKISLVGMIAAKITGVPKRIYTCRGFRFEHEKGRFRKFLITIEKLISSCSHKVICISNSVKDLGISEGIFKESKVVVFGKGSSNGLNLELFSRDRVTEEERKEYIEKYGLEGFYVYGFVGRLVDRKGIAELYAAFDNLYSRNKNVKLLVVGRPYWDQIKNPKLIDDYNSHPGIVMAGIQPQDTIPAFLSVFNVFVLPAWWEGFGNVLTQAAAMGVPIIGTNSTGCKDAVSNGYNGVLVAPYSVSEFEEAMEYFYNNQEEVKKYGENGVEWAKNFKPEVIWEAMYGLYES
ncbi:glycosyltransferase family 4 protein [Flavobacterium salilacus subsp. salilacus]|uniref:glycosyltransferase family 4 protein n=1 Tax=Flavobacterium TaxID=237 RepID=UPI001074FC4F|nr:MULTISPECIES: glycosyltransferase family 4 protein [Flavobacterium]KAF2519763.1 glycosyltransferase family 4 protein [Flavobacterium salilacus subsp. salilacus]MBE1614342.1 glycosyltransferase family 4 protein [Flavobacterium sp. SaA2.13]